MADPEITGSLVCEDCGQTVALEADKDFDGLAWAHCDCGATYADSWDGTFKLFGEGV